MILSLRDPELAARDKRLLARYGIAVLPSPVAVAEPVSFDLSMGTSGDGFIITSQQAAAYLPPHHKDRPVYVVGARSAAAVKARGYNSVIIGTGDGADLAKLMQSRSLEASLCWLRGHSISFDMKEALKDNTNISEVICYQMKQADTLLPEVIGALGNGAVKAVMALSSHQLSHFEQLLHQHDLWQAHKQIDLLALSPAIADLAGSSAWQSIYTARRKRAVSVRALAVCKYRV